MKDFNGKVAVITGGASGIGYAMAERFAAEGMRLVLADIETGALESASERLRKSGTEVAIFETDVRYYEQLEALADFTARRFGSVHLLCNNAGVSITGPTWSQSMDDWRWVLDVNLWGVIHGVRAFLPGMLAHGEPAHILNTGSLASFNGIGGHAPYCASKAAVLGLSQSLYSEMKAMMTNVGVSVLCPGMVDTLIHRSWRNRPQDDQPWSDREFTNDDFMNGSEALQRSGISPAEVAKAALDAVRGDRFYIFTNEGSARYIDASAGRAARGENPFVFTWGEDRRAEEARGTPPWQAQQTR